MENKTHRLYIDGPLNAQALDSVEQDIKDLTVEPGDIVIMDCTDMSYICSSGLRIFLRMHKDLTVRSSKLIIRGLQPLVKGVFDMSGFSKILNIEE